MLVVGGWLSALGITITAITALAVDPGAYPAESLALFSVGGLLTLALPAAMVLEIYLLVRKAFSP